MSGHRLAVLAVASLLLVGFALPVDASSRRGNENAPFVRISPDTTSPTGQSVLADCQATGAEDPEGWTDATATLRLRHVRGDARVVIDVRDARPDTYFTVWLRLTGTDSNGDPFGASPLTGLRATPLAPTSHLPEMLAATGPGNGTDELVNGFWTDRRGNARFRLHLDFPISGGAYPFHRFPDWDPTDPRLPAEDPAVHPVAIAGPQAPFTLRVISHCTDEIGHGLLPGPHEEWFDWTVSS